MSATRLAEKLKLMMKEAADGPARRYFVVTKADPLTAKDTASGVVYDEDEDNFDLSGYAAFYLQNVGLEAGDLLLCHPVNTGDDEVIWVATSVTTNNPHPLIPPEA